MKKRALALAMAVLMTASLSACGSSKPGTSTTAAPAETTTAAAESKGDTSKKSDSSTGYEIALVTDLGTIDDKSFNQGAWEGMKKYAEEKGISYKRCIFVLCIHERQRFQLIPILRPLVLQWKAELS